MGAGKYISCKARCPDEKRIFLLVCLTSHFTVEDVRGLPTRTNDFASDPGWSILGNQSNGNSFGWSRTSRAGGGRGEIGGRFTRSEFTRSYADIDWPGVITLEDEFEASGIFTLTEQNRPDFGRPFFFGYFAESGLNTNSPRNFLGINVDNGGTVNSAFWTLVLQLADGTDLAPAKSAITVGQSMPWSYRWNPSAGANGTFSASLGQVSKSVALTAAQRNLGITLDSFGFAGVGAPGSQESTWFAELFIDDVSYSIGTPPLSGDYDNSGNVSQRDLDILLIFWGEDHASVPLDFSGDRPTGIINQDDLDRVLLNWGATQGLAAESVAVPEPATVGLLNVVVAYLAIFRAFRRQDSLNARHA